MRPSAFIFAVLISCFAGDVYGQFEGFKQWYPIGDDADLHVKTSYTESEKILFEGNPIVRYSVYNDMLSAIDEATGKNGHAGYIAFKPQLRMYTDESLPVKTPSYRVQLGYQHLLKLSATSSSASFLSIGLESGHYSNGQSGSAFSDLYLDGSPQGDSVYTHITDETNLSELLNRRSGNFSTNITELSFNYRSYRFSSPNIRIPNASHSLTLGLVVYHDRFLGTLDFGGYSEDDIKIYGRFRYQIGYEYAWVIPNTKGGKSRTLPRVSVSERIELIQGAHPWVNPFRSESRISLSPGGKANLGFSVFAGGIYGHDNYNFRFVDSGWQLVAGLSWTPSPLPFIGRKQDVVIDPENADDGM